MSRRNRIIDKKIGVMTAALAVQTPEVIETVEAALGIAREIIAEHMGDLEPRVRAVLDQEFEQRVAATAREVLEDKLSEIRRRLA